MSCLSIAWWSWIYRYRLSSSKSWWEMCLGNIITKGLITSSNGWWKVFILKGLMENAWFRMHMMRVNLMQTSRLGERSFCWYGTSCLGRKVMHVCCMQCIWKCQWLISFFYWSLLFWGWDLLGTNADWIWIYDDANKVDFSFLVVTNRDWTCSLGKGFDFPTLDIWRCYNRRINTDALGAPSLILSWSCVFVPERTSISFPDISWQLVDDCMSVAMWLMQNDHAFALPQFVGYSRESSSKGNLGGDYCSGKFMIIKLLAN